MRRLLAGCGRPIVVPDLVVTSKVLAQRKPPLALVLPVHIRPGANYAQSVKHVMSASYDRRGCSAPVHEGKHTGRV
jgi:hypothetical protein